MVTYFKGSEILKMIEKGHVIVRDHRGGYYIASVPMLPGDREVADADRVKKEIGRIYENDTIRVEWAYESKNYTSIESGPFDRG